MKVLRYVLQAANCHLEKWHMNIDESLLADQLGGMNEIAAILLYVMSVDVESAETDAFWCFNEMMVAPWLHEPQMATSGGMLACCRKSYTTF